MNIKITQESPAIEILQLIRVNKTNSLYLGRAKGRNTMFFLERGPQWKGKTGKIRWNH